MRGPVAPWRHTWLTIAILTTVGGIGWMTARQGVPGGAPAHAGAGTYAAFLFAEYGLVALVRSGLRQAGTSLAALVSARPLDRSAVAVDLGLGLVLLVLWLGIEWLLRSGASPSVARIVVADWRLAPLWVLLALAAGFAEELAFRGYLQRQFAVAIGTPRAVIAQAVLFAALHGYQGGATLVRIAAFGLLTGGVAAWRRSIVPGMVAHTLNDVIAGLRLIG